MTRRTGEAWFGETTAIDAATAGDIEAEGDGAKLEELVSYRDSFEFWFNVVTP